jgi:hypothetical protein
MNSHLVNHLLTLFAKGELPATQVQSILYFARKDGWGPAGDRLGSKLASAGSEGLHKSNIHRDIISRCRAAGLMSSGAMPYHVKLPDNTSVQMFLPHEIFHHMAAKEGLPNLCLPAEELHANTGPGALLRSWAEHRDVNFTGDLKDVAMLGLHCDGVPYTNSVRAGGGKSIFVCSLNCFSAAAESVKRKRHTLFTLQKARLCDCGCSGFHTLELLFSILVWSLRCLALGLSPASRHDDTPWTAADDKGRLPSSATIPRAAMLQVRGDWEFFETAFRFRSVNSDAFCWKCQATKSPGPFCAWDFRPEAPHRSTSISHVAYMASCLATGSGVPALFRSPGFVIDYVAIDSMHSGDLGVFQDATGSLFWLFCYNQQWNRNRMVGLASLHKLIAEHYKAHSEKNHSRVFPTMAQIKSKKTPKYPYLKAKAAETRHLAEFCMVLARLMRFGGPGIAPLKFRLSHPMAGKEEQILQSLTLCFDNMAFYHRSCAAEPFVAVDCKTTMYRFLQGFASLHTIWRVGRPEAECAAAPWHLRPKAHVLQHLVEDQLRLWGSPSRSWCYRDEDFVGAVKRIAARSMHPSTLEARLTEKLCLLSGLSSGV